jgi:hypothetical protein
MQCNAVKDSNTVDIPAEQTAVLFETNNAGTITNILLRTDQKDELAALEFVAWWDNANEPFVRCPVYLLSGTSERMENVSSLPACVQNSTADIRWTMPYRSAKIAIRNTSAKPVHLNYSVQTTEQYSRMRFEGQYLRYNNLQTDNINVLSLAKITGTGRIVACNLQVKSRTGRWWGEGDQLIYLDSKQSPSWQGTGTEDYFGFAWCSKKRFNHAFRGQSSVTETPLERTSAMHRYHFLDTLPFHYSAEFKTEAWGLTSGSMDYVSLILYYTEQ